MNDNFDNTSKDFDRTRIEVDNEQNKIIPEDFYVNNKKQVDKLLKSSKICKLIECISPFTAIAGIALYYKGWINTAFEVGKNGILISIIGEILALGSFIVGFGAGLKMIKNKIKMRTLKSNYEIEQIKSRKKMLKKTEQTPPQLNQNNPIWSNEYKILK